MQPSKAPVLLERVVMLFLHRTNIVERVARFELALSAWKADVVAI